MTPPPPSSAPAAVVLAAGKGTRMKSAHSKVVFPVLGVPIVRRVVEAAQAAGCSDVVVVVGHEAHSVRATVPGARFAVQAGMPGTGGAVAAARGAMDYRGRTVLVLPGDAPLMRADTLSALVEDHEAQGAVLTVATMRVADPTGYGRIVREAVDGPVLRIVEHRDADESLRRIDEVNTSIYAFSGDFLFGLRGDGGAVARLSPLNDQQEYLLTDVVALAVADRHRVGAFLIADELETAGVNDRAQLAQLELALRRRINEAWLRAGVSLDDPATTRIEESVTLGRDVLLGASVELRGTTRLAEGVSVGTGSILTDCVVEAGAVVGPYVVAHRASIGAGAQIRAFSSLQGVDEKHPDLSSEADRVLVGPAAAVGPFAHLRQASVLERNARAGNFVEIKKTTLREGAKANHLAYLGDADIGARSNIGAGVITCNYDGFAKHRTVVGADAFVGTDSHLIAPVTVGEGAYVATGTTVTRDVPPGALAVGRARQENKLGYAPRLKAQLEARSRTLAEQRARAGGADPE